MHHAAEAADCAGVTAVKYTARSEETMMIGWTTLLLCVCMLDHGALAEPKPAVRPAAAEVAPAGGGKMRFEKGAPVRIVLVGDSTVNAEGGWGKGFCADLTPQVTCINEALNGRSSKSFIDEGAWAKALADKGDFYLIQFGHNDQKPDAARHTDPSTSYATNLRRYIRDVREAGGLPVLVTSLSRRSYKDGVLVEDLKEYAAAAKQVAAEENVTVIDLNAMSTALLKAMTQEQADSFDATGHADQAAENAAAKRDRTHLNAKGQAVFGRMVADALARAEVELRLYVIREPS